MSPGIEKPFRAVVTKLMLNRSTLAETVEAAKTQNKTVVFTNGCFDIVHIGHIRYLQDARAQGDVLVVGVNADVSVRKLKGEGRPLVPELERAEVLAALECVDFVTLFNEDTPVELIRTIRPNIHVKGGDYQPQDLPEADAVREIGGEIRIVPYTSTNTEGRSTTSLIGKIVNNSRG